MMEQIELKLVVEIIILLMQTILLVTDMQLAQQLQGQLQKLQPIQIML
jgi:hypothetical protein